MVPPRCSSYFTQALANNFGRQFVNDKVFPVPCHIEAYSSTHKNGVKVLLKVHNDLELAGMGLFCRA